MAFSDSIRNSTNAMLVKNAMADGLEEVENDVAQSNTTAGQAVATSNNAIAQVAAIIKDQDGKTPVEVIAAHHDNITGTDYGSIGERSDSVSRQLADNVIKATSKTKVSALYSAATRDINNLIYTLLNVINALSANKSLKVAFWGDSITEGFNNYIDDIYANLFLNALKKMMPDVNIQSTNFGLGSRTSMMANDINYVAHNPESPWNGTEYPDFWRSWSVEGKSWKQHITDYKPDILLIAFGMNDSIYANGQFLTNIQAMIAYVNANSPATDIVLVSAIMPTENKDIYGQNSEKSLQVAREIREYANQNNIPLIDANRLWRICLYGVEEGKTHTIQTTLATTIGQPSYAFDMRIGLSTYSLDSANPTDIHIRGNSDTDAGFLIRICKSTASGNNVVEMYDMTTGFSGSGAVQISFGSLGYEIPAITINTIVINGSSIVINGYAIVNYKYLREGMITNITNQGNISAFDCYIKTKMTENPVYTELDMLGTINGNTNVGTGGNGINHLTALGHYLSYYQASMSIVNSIKRAYERSLATLGFVQKHALSLQSSWVPFDNTGARETGNYQMFANRLVRLNGMIMDGIITAGTIISILPEGFRPSANKIIRAFAAEGLIYLQIDTQGNLTVFNNFGHTNAWLNLEGVEWYAEY